MQEKNLLLMISLSGSVLMMMLVSVIFSVPAPVALAANISAPLERFHEPKIVSQEFSDIDTLFADLHKNNPEKAQEFYEILLRENSTRIVSIQK